MSAAHCGRGLTLSPALANGLRRLSIGMSVNSNAQLVMIIAFQAFISR
jgi:hypothetical protein